MSEDAKELLGKLKDLLNVPPGTPPLTAADINTAEYMRSVALFSFDYGIRFIMQIVQEFPDALYDKEAMYKQVMDLLAQVAEGDITLVPTEQDVMKERKDVIEQLKLDEKTVHSTASLARKLEKLICIDYLAQAIGVVE